MYSYSELNGFQNIKNINYNEQIGGYIFEIKPEDTKDFVFDIYYYDVGLQTAEGDFYTVVECSILEIRPGITAKI